MSNRCFPAMAILILILMAGVPFTGATSAHPDPAAFYPGGSFELGGPDTRALLSADFNGDGHPDLAATLFRDTEDDGLTILFGDGLGGFPDGTSFVSGFRVYGLAAGDFDGDGLVDLASTEGTQVKPYPRPPCGIAVSVPVFLNTGAVPGRFAWDTCLESGAFPIAPLAANFNGDGAIDLAVVDNVGDDVTVFLGNGSGGFSPGLSTGALFTRPESLAAGDWNRDGHLDLAVGHLDSFAGRGITVLRGSGDGTFAVSQSVYSGSAARGVHSADFNADGFLDLVGADQGGGRIWVCTGRGDGTFADGLPTAAGTYPNDLAVADLNGDGKPDVVTANSGSDDATLLLGQGDGRFNPGGTFPAGPEPQDIAVADFNWDGLPDIAVSARNAGQQGTVLILLQVQRPRLLPGDCDGDGSVSIGECQKAVDMFLGLQPPACGADCSGDDQVSIGEVQKVIGAFLGLAPGC